MKADDTHECPGPGCVKRVPFRMLACKRHWYQVSFPTRSRVWSTWANGMSSGTAEHIAAMADAVAEMKP